MTFMDYVQLIFLVFVIIPIVFMIFTHIISVVAPFIYRMFKNLYRKWENKNTKFVCEEQISLD